MELEKNLLIGAECKFDSKETRLKKIEERVLSLLDVKDENLIQNVSIELEAKTVEKDNEIEGFYIL